MNLTASTLQEAWSVTLLSRVLKIPPLTGDEKFFHGHTRLIAKWEWLRYFLPARLCHFEIDFDVKGMKPYREKGEGSKREKDRDWVIGVYLVGWKNSPAAARRSPANFLGPLAG